MIKVLYEDNHLLVVEKPVNIAVQADSSSDEDLLTMLKQYIKDKYNKPGNVYLGLVHRLDRPVGGVMVFARTSKAASRLSDVIRKNQLEKDYLAVLCGEAEKSGHFEDYLIKDEKTNTSKVTSSDKGKLALLNYELLDQRDGLSLVSVHLLTGRSHQIRVQFSSRGLPLWGDQRYNPAARVGQQIALFANKLSFDHPVTRERMTFELPLPQAVPFNKFRK